MPKFIDPKQLNLDFSGLGQKRLSIFDRIKLRQIQLDPKRSKTWFIKNIKTSFLMGITPQQLLSDQKENLTAATFIGKMFFFFYDPKTKEQLPFYDKFPLIIPIDIYSDGFLGLNLHYLDVYNRIQLLDKLLDFATDKLMDEKTKLIVTYNMLEGITRYAKIYPCLKRYLSNHVRSRFIPINAPDWEIAVALPVERFAKQKPIYVHAHSMKQVRSIQRKIRKRK